MEKKENPFVDSKHVEWLGLIGNESKVKYDEFSTVKLEIIFKAKSPQETDLALCEIVEKATAFFRMPNDEGYYFRMPGEVEKSIIGKINACPETPTIQALNIELDGLQISKNLYKKT